jgi:transcriptional regulator with XRE-family HTH domain
MSELGQRLRVIRRQRGLSLRQVEGLTVGLAKKSGDPLRKVSASWLGRIEREEHSITHKTLETLEEVYGIRREELTGEYVSEAQAFDMLHARIPGLPAAIFKGLTDPAGEHLLPPERWLAYFPETTLLPVLPTGHKDSAASGRGRLRAERLYGVLGAQDFTLLGLVQPGAVLEIDHSARTIDSTTIYPSVSERPIYFLRSHDGYHCGWCELDGERKWLTLVPSALAKLPQRKWRYRNEIEVVGTVTRVLTRLSFSQLLRFEHVNHDQRSNSC